MKILRNRFIIGTICIMIGLAVSFLAIPQLTQSRKSETVAAIRLTKNINKGDPITLSAVEKINIDKSSLPAGFITELVPADDLFAAADLFTGDFLTTTKTTECADEQDPMVRATAQNLKVVSISLPSLASSVSGKLQPGDIVTIMALPKSNTAERSQMLSPGTSHVELSQTEEQSEEPDNNAKLSPSNEMNTLIYPELRFLEICSINALDGRAANVSDYPADDQKNVLPATISFFVTESQALRLAELEQKSIIHLSFVARADDADKFISPDKLVLSGVN